MSDLLKKFKVIASDLVPPDTVYAVSGLVRTPPKHPPRSRHVVNLGTHGYVGFEDVVAIKNMEVEEDERRKKSKAKVSNVRTLAKLE